MADTKNSSRKNSQRKNFPRIVFIIIVGIVILLAVLYLYAPFKKSAREGERKTIENPLQKVIFENTNAKGEIDTNKVVEEAVIAFNEEYIRYILIALSVHHLHASSFGYGNPLLELQIDDEIWSAEIIDGTVHIQKQAIANEDAIIFMSKKEVVRALLSSNLENFMTESVKSGRTKIEMVADKTELFTKGYLKMYQELTE